MRINAAHPCKLSLDGSKGRNPRGTHLRFLHIFNFDDLRTGLEVERWVNLL